MLRIPGADAVRGALEWQQCSKSTRLALSPGSPVLAHCQEQRFAEFIKLSILLSQ